MDDLDCSGEVVVQTLKELDYINRKLGGNHISIESLQRLIPKNHKDKVSIIDLGCGGGDILKDMADWGRKNNIELKLTGIDANPEIITYAIENCKDYPEISFEIINIWSEAFTTRKFDVYHSSLFTHHFSEQELIKLFSICYRSCSLGIIDNDLQRHWFAYYSIKWLTGLFSNSAMVQNDAAVSVQRGFHKAELVKILQKAGIEQFSLKWRWAFRWQVVIDKCKIAH
jgi:2-polyprenyl-3-methyl-5-hydroxy-6-metoxy-1,4-benzoquinol methylase